MQLVATWTGLIGGAAGFLSILIQARSLYLDSPQVRLNFSSVLIPTSGKDYLSIEVINRGGKAITIASVGVQYKNSNHSPFSLYPPEERLGPDFPFRLESHSSATWLVGSEATLEAIKKQSVESRIAVYSRTALGHTRISAFKNLEL